MPVHVVQPMVQTIESILCGDLGLKGKDFNLSRQFYENQMELLRSLKSSFCPENENLLHNSQLYPTPNTSFTLLVSELHSIIPLGRTAGALREGWTGIMRDHLRRIIPHTTWYFKRSAFSHPDTRKRAAPLFKCEAVCAERTCPNTIKMCATKSDPLRVNVKFGQGMCIHMVRKRILQTTLANLDCKIGISSSGICEKTGLSPPYSCLTPPQTSPSVIQTPFHNSPPSLIQSPYHNSSPPLIAGTLTNSSSPLIQTAGSLRATQTPVIQCPASLMAPSSTGDVRRGDHSDIKRPVPLRITQEDRKRSYCRLRSNEDQDAPSAFHIVASPPKRARVGPTLKVTTPTSQPLLDQAFMPVPDISNSLINFDFELQRHFALDRGIAT